MKRFSIGVASSWIGTLRTKFNSAVPNPTTSPYPWFIATLFMVFVISVVIIELFLIVAFLTGNL